MAKGVLACILAVGFFAAAVHAAPSKPGLRLLAKSPVTLRGTGFHARERVHVTAAAGGMRQVRTTTATRAGAFTVRLPASARLRPVPRVAHDHRGRQARRHRAAEAPAAGLPAGSLSGNYSLTGERVFV